MSFSKHDQTQELLGEAEDQFKRGNLENAMGLAVAAKNLRYFVAYLIHKAVAVNRNYYRLLKVSDPFADHETIRKAFKRMALLLHPDKNKSAAAEHAFKIITSVWSVLSDPVRRMAYNAQNGFVPPHMAASVWKKVKQTNAKTYCNGDVLFNVADGSNMYNGNKKSNCQGNLTSVHTTCVRNTAAAKANGTKYRYVSLTETKVATTQTDSNQAVKTASKRRREEVTDNNTGTEVKPTLLNRRREELMVKNSLSEVKTTPFKRRREELTSSNTRREVKTTPLNWRTEVETTPSKQRKEELTGKNNGTEVKDFRTESLKRDNSDRIRTLILWIIIDWLKSH